MTHQSQLYYYPKDNIVPIWTRLKSGIQGYSPVRHLANAAFPFSDKSKYMFMLSAYMDETGHSKDERQRFVGIAGLIAPAAYWEMFEEKWKETLKLPYIDLPYFHMTDFATRKKVYKDWSEAKRQKVFGKLLNVIESIYPLPFGSIIPMEDYRKLADEHKEYFIDPYFFCFQSCVAACTSFLAAKKVPDEEKIALIFSDQVEFRYRAQQLYDLVKETGLFTFRSPPPIFNDMREIVPLQGADIIAYEMYKEFERQLYRPNDDTRFGYKRIVKMSERNGYPKPMFWFFPKNVLNEHIEIYEQTKKKIEQMEKEHKKAS